MADIQSLTLTETMQALERKEFSEGELNLTYQKRIAKLNDKLNVYLDIQVTKTGIPAAIKDLISTKGIRTSAGSKIIENYKPPYNATVINKLIANGVSLIGKTNQDEFAMGSSGENSAYRVTKNPWDLTKVPGGSSSGSAAAVAADMCVFSLGTDTGGSIRQPASLCGVVGLKPSYGRVSRYGAIAMSSSLDQIGPITKSVEDAAKVLEWISGPDGYDSNCSNFKFQNNTPAARTNFKFQIDLKGLKVGIPKEYFGKGIDPGVEQVIKKAIKKLEELGAEIVEISLPHSEYALAVYYIIMPSEVSSNLARFDGIRYGLTRDKFGSEPKRRIMLGTYALSSGYYEAYFKKAAQVRTLIIQDFQKAFGKVDVIVGPVSPTVAWDLGKKTDDPLSMYLSDIYTVPASLAGLCGLSVPCGFSEGLPVGLHILGKQFDEATVFKVGYAYEQATQWHLKKPEIARSLEEGDNV
ncbi:Asp-tRNA(Asn)/Glu-tRNA(Gln) amidotransferase subunit GatA [Candidatus Daviesbacteria bacterium]|nr:Asp-tRNA(Asn)/Glu-tRNA(Gln) amidotransferase subunit GatA [Candidatus Daviesbacteria bacterium]